MRVTHLLETHIRAQIVKKRVTSEGEVIAYHQEELEVRENWFYHFWEIGSRNHD